MSILTQTLFFSGIVLVTTGLISGCSHDNNEPMDVSTNKPMETYGYQISIQNLTAAQPLSPVAVVLHKQGYHPYTVGMPASIGLEQLAESGANANFIKEAKQNNHVLITHSGAGIITPTAMEIINMETTIEKGTAGPMLELSLASMLANTNDAIAGLNALDLSKLQNGESITLLLSSYDVGTEANSETQDTIPGPAATGGAQQGYNPARDDTMDAVLAHSGVVTQDDGLATSTLNAVHKWDNPVASIMITRTQ